MSEQKGASATSRLLKKKKWTTAGWWSRPDLFHQQQQQKPFKCFSVYCTIFPNKRNYNKVTRNLLTHFTTLLMIFDRELFLILYYNDAYEILPGAVYGLSILCWFWMALLMPFSQNKRVFCRFFVICRKLSSLPS